MKKQIKALIPARGGSKGIPNKNMSILNGHPLLYYTIKEALKIFDSKDIFLSSDSDKILDYGNKFNINLLKRPSEISGDNATSSEVIKHFIQNIELVDKENFTIIYLQPTSPLRNANDIDESIKLYNKNECGSLISVKKLQDFPEKAYKLDENNRLTKKLDSMNSSELRQDLPNSYYPNGAIYIFEKTLFLKEGLIPQSNILPYIMNELNSIDIDTKSDLRIAEIILRDSIK